MTSRFGLSKFGLLVLLTIFGFAMSCASSSDIEQVQSDAGHLSQEINSLQASQESLRVDNDFYKADLKKLEDANTQLFLMLSDQAKELNDQSVLVTIQADKIATQASEINAQMDAIVSQSSEITGQSEQINTQAKQINIQAQQILDLQSSLENQGIQITAQQQKSKNLEGKVSAQGEVAGQLKSDLEAQKAADDDLLEKINKLPTTVCSIEDSSADVRSNTFKVTISLGYGTGTGTAFFIGNSEFITNEHVVDSGGRILLSNDQQKFYATIVATSPSRDLALLKVSNYLTLTATGLTTVELTDSDTGKQIGVTGYPKGLGDTPSVSYGVISRVFLDDNENEKMQTDAAISPGSSGGPVFNECGEVVGVISSKLTGTSIEGIGFAFSSDTLTNFLSDVSGRGLR
jgi:S1-C subfamily serine protease